MSKVFKPQNSFNRDNIYFNVSRIQSFTEGDGNWLNIEFGNEEYVQFAYNTREDLLKDIERLVNLMGGTE